MAPLYEAPNPQTINKTMNKTLTLLTTIMALAATFGLSEDQVTALLVADAGVTVAVSLSDLVT